MFGLGTPTAQPKTRLHRTWQVHGGSEIPFDEMVALDYHYVTSWSLGRDFRLIVRTIPALFESRSSP